MFNFLKNKKSINLCSPCEGTYVKLSDVEDNFFSKGYAGQGFSVKPTSEGITSPVDGIVRSIFPTKHAISIECDNGLEILVHIGIDTVKLKGDGMEILITEGERVKVGDLLAKVDFNKVRAAGYLDNVLVIVSNAKSFNIKINKICVKSGEVVANCEWFKSYKNIK